MKLNIKYFFILLALLSSFVLKAQDIDAVEYSKFQLKIALGNHTVGFPYENSWSAFNPHFSFGFEKRINKSLKNQLFLGSNLGFFRNEVIGNTLTIDFDLGYRYINKTGLFTDVSLGIGFIDQFHPKNVFRQNTTDGTYTKLKNQRRASSLIGLKMGFGYDFSKKSKHSFAIGISHNFFIQTSYFDVNNFPIMPQSTTNIFIIYKFKKS